MEDRLINGHNGNLYKALSTPQREFLDGASEKYHFTFQEIKKLMEFAIDLDAWNEHPLSELFRPHELKTKHLRGKQKKEHLLKGIEEEYHKIKSKDISYSSQTHKPTQPDLNINYKDDEHTIFGFCPVQSEKTLCCNLRTIDAVLGCGYGCNYCALKSTYEGSQVVFHKNLRKKLSNLSFEKNRLYHLGTGQSSDALMWGNKDGMLDILVDFAKQNPNLFLEFKTKSDNIKYLLENKIPANVFPSFSLNPDVVIENEEHFTATLHERLLAARKVANKGIKVAFHFHPILIFAGWEKKYSRIAKEIMGTFKDKEILFISMGSLFFPKPVLRKIRLSGAKTKIYKYNLVENSEGKLTVSDEDKLTMFRHVYGSFAPIQNRVFFYLCMEEKEIWNELFGQSFDSNEAFENKFLSTIYKKIHGRSYEG
jgi:spore photoproduct lyase